MSEIIRIVSDEELSLVENNALGQQQLAHLLKTTPAKYVKKRPAKGGGTMGLCNREVMFANV